MDRRAEQDSASRSTRPDLGFGAHHQNVFLAGGAGAGRQEVRMTIVRSRFAVRCCLVLGACLLSGLASITPNLARPDFGVRGGAYSEEEEAFLGAEALFNMDGERNWFGNPNIEHAFIEDGDLTSLSFDFHYDFIDNKPYTMWVGGGPTVLFRDGDAFEEQDDTDPGANVLFGVGSTEGTVRPYGQFKVIVTDDTQAVLAAGIRF
jgi:hypothetical protein